MLEGLALCLVHDLWRRAAAAHIDLGCGAKVVAVVRAIVDTALDLCLRRSTAAAGSIVGGRTLFLCKGCAVSAGGGHRLVAVYLDSGELAQTCAVVGAFLDFT